VASLASGGIEQNEALLKGINVDNGELRINVG